ncbi:MAG: cytochrome P450 [Actinobacteria bacterium]|nr:cytochrome P450 [Actinomycetota bacterium]
MTATASGGPGPGEQAAPDPPVGLDPFAPGFFADPYVQYAALREHAPVHPSPFGPWMLTRYADCVRLLRNPDVSVEDRNREAGRRMALFGADDPRRHRGRAAILNLDPPAHTRIRRLAGKAFTPRRVEALGPRIDALVTGALDRVAADGGMDVIADLAFPLPFAVISEMLGIPDADSAHMRDVSHTLVRTLEPLTAPDDLPLLRAASDAMREFVDEMIGWKRSHPGDDLLTALIEVRDGGDMLSEAELHDQVALLYIAGHETTVNLIGNGTLALLRHPDQLALLRDDPALVPNAVEELLRFDGPVQFSRRITLTDLTIDDVTIPAGAFVFTVLGAANRDPSHFGPDADRLDLTRRLAPQHLSFGGGIHHCLGAVLARAEARAAIGALARRFPDLALATDAPAWNGRLVLRGLDALPVTFS